MTQNRLHIDDREEFLNKIKETLYSTSNHTMTNFFPEELQELIIHPMITKRMKAIIENSSKVTLTTPVYQIIVDELAYLKSQNPYP
jgi:hypothetical protein